jgi:hypothetical protein
MEQSHDARSTPSSYEALARFDGLKKASIAPLVSPTARFYFQKRKVIKSRSPSVHLEAHSPRDLS